MVDWNARRAPGCALGVRGYTVDEGMHAHSRGFLGADCGERSKAERSAERGGRA